MQKYFNHFLPEFIKQPFSFTAMNDKVIAKLSLCCSAFGLLLLFVISIFMEAEDVPISGIEASEAKDVLVTGQVISVKMHDNLAVVEVAEVKSVEVVVFDRRMLGFGIGDNVSVSGELRDYKGKREIVAEKIRVTS